MRNKEVHEKFKRSGVMKWQVAERLGINDGNFSRRLRRELQTDQKKEILNIIEELEKKQKKVGE